MNISKKIYLFTIVAFFFIPFVSLAEGPVEENNPFALSTEVGFFSDYMDRGQNLFDGASIQPVIDASWNTESIGVIGGYVWSHLSVDQSRSSEERFTEIDYVLYHSLTVDIVTFRTEANIVSYPDGSYNHTNELWLSLGLDLPIVPTFTFVRDFTDVLSNWYLLNLSKTITSDCLGETFNLTPYIEFVFASNAAGRAYDENGLESVSLGLSSDLNLGDISVTPSIHYTFKIDETTSNVLWFGVAFGYGS